MRAKSFMAVGLVVVASAAAPRARARKPISEEAQRRVLLEQLAAASAEVPAQEKTDADLMYEAMRQWRGEPRGSRAVDQVLAQSKTDIRQDRKVLEDRVRAMFWKDPFSSELVPVQKANRNLLRQHAARVARARGDAGDDENARLRADLATARSENARLRADLAAARASDSGGDVDAQATCVAPSRHLHARRFESGGRPHRDGGYLEAMSSPPPVHHHHAGSAKARARKELAAVAPTPVAPAEAVTGPPAGWRSSDPRGIIVVPIEAPVPIHADKPSARAH